MQLWMLTSLFGVAVTIAVVYAVIRLFTNSAQREPLPAARSHGMVTALVALFATGTSGLTGLVFVDELPWARGSADAPTGITEFHAGRPPRRRPDRAQPRPVAAAGLLDRAAHLARVRRTPPQRAPDRPLLDRVLAQDAHGGGRRPRPHRPGLGPVAVADRPPPPAAAVR